MIFLIITSTLANHYLEIFKRENKKPEFTKLIKFIIKNNTEKNIVFYDYTATSDFVFNYLKQINLNGIEDLNIIQFKNNIPSDLNSFWLICYTPRVNFDCSIPNLEKWKQKQIKKKYLVEAKLFKLD